MVIGSASTKTGFVFTEPAGGWSGLLTPTAALTGPTSGDFGHAVAVSGSTIVIGDPLDNLAETFREPPGGWSGTLNATATLTEPGTGAFGQSVAVLEPTVLAGASDTTVRSNPAQGAAYVYGDSPSRPVGYALTGFASPKPWSSWHARSSVRITARVDVAGGGPLPDPLAYSLSANCELRVRASGALTLPARCMHYDHAAGLFSYDWRLGRPGSGLVNLQLQLTYPSPSTASERIRISALRGG